MKKTGRTDLAFELISEQAAVDGVTLTKGEAFGREITHVKVTEDGVLGKPKGNFFTVNCCSNYGSGSDKSARERDTDALHSILKELLGGCGRILIAGLGNDSVTPDSLGVKSVRKIHATAHLKDFAGKNGKHMREVYVTEPGVLARTGLESAEQLRLLTQGIKPDAVVAIDSLACSEPSRLCRTIQVTDSGISPGSGVKNSRREISEKTLGVPVIAVGVPTVIDFDCDDPDMPSMLVPRDIDVSIARFSNVIADSVNRLAVS